MWGNWLIPIPAPDTKAKMYVAFVVRVKKGSDAAEDGDVPKTRGGASLKFSSLSRAYRFRARAKRSLNRAWISALKAYQFHEKH